MTSQKEGESSNNFHNLHAERDLEANWEVDLAKKLQDYLFKICSGEITGSEDDDSSHVPVNFAEAALLLQGSVQVYSRKVEYLYNLVLHALDFLSQQRQQEESEGTSAQHDQESSREASDERNDQFWGVDDVPVDPRNCLDASTTRDAAFYNFVKPPANLVVLEGDCLDTSGDTGELESYLLSTSDLYHDFILLDPSDAVAVDDYLKTTGIGKGQNDTHKGSSMSKTFFSPSRRTGGTGRKATSAKRRDDNPNQSPFVDCRLGGKNSEAELDPPNFDNFEERNPGFLGDDGYAGPSNSGDSDDDDNDDPWEPLNPHEPGNLKVKPFRKVKAFSKIQISRNKQTSITTLFPLARMHGPISPELMELWEKQQSKSHEAPDSPTLYEKLRQSLATEGQTTFDNFGVAGDENEGDEVPDFSYPDNEMPEMMDEDFPIHHEKHDDGHVDNNEAFECENPSSQVSLEDLCRSHLDALLANIAETENQTELAARVSSWKQKIEHNLDEQDSRPPFDIHAYGERIIDKLFVDENTETTMSFSEVVKGQEKHDVARTFSALLQLVNNGDVELEKNQVSDELSCYTAVNPFHVRLLKPDKRQKETRFKLQKKRVKSSVTKRRSKDEASPESNRKSAIKLGKVGGVRSTPDSKRRRRSSLLEPLNPHSGG